MVNEKKLKVWFAIWYDIVVGFLEVFNFWYLEVFIKEFFWLGGLMGILLYMLMLFLILR